MPRNKASFTLSRCTPRCVPVVCSRWTGANRERIWVRSYIPVSATDQTRFVAKSDHCLFRLCYGLRRYIPGVAPESLRCASVRPYTPRLCPVYRRQSPGVTTASHGSRTAKPRCYTVAYKYQCNSRRTYYRYVICKRHNSSNIPRQNRTAIRVGSKIGNGESNITLPPYHLLSLVLEIIENTCTCSTNNPSKT